MTRLGAPRRLLSRLALVPDETERRVALEERLEVVYQELIPALLASIQELSDSLQSTNRRLDLVVDESTRRAEASLAQVVIEVQRLGEKLNGLSNRQP